MLGEILDVYKQLVKKMGKEDHEILHILLEMWQTAYAKGFMQREEFEIELEDG